MKFTSVFVALAAIAGVKAQAQEQHTVIFTNKCGFGTVRRVSATLHIMAADYEL